MGHRKTLDTKRPDERWVKNKKGEWRYQTDEVEGHIFNRRATRQHPGFARGARISKDW
jgi:hypothetical protein